MATEPDSVRFANLEFRGLHRSELLRYDGSLKWVITVNAEIIVEANRNPEIAELINRNWATFDGQWPYLLAKWKTGRGDIEKISGSDFVYELCEFAGAQGLKVFLLGGSGEVNRRAAQHLRESYGVEVDGFAPPKMSYPFDVTLDNEIVERVRAYQPDILVVCLGAPKQELWISCHQRELERMGVRWVIGAGGTLDFISGAIRRAPVFLQRAGLESLWRLMREPKTRIVRVLRAFLFLRYA